MSFRRLSALAVTVLVALTLLACSAVSADGENAANTLVGLRRYVVVGDVYGELSRFQNPLLKANIVRNPTEEEMNTPLFQKKHRIHPWRAFWLGTQSMNAIGGQGPLVPSTTVVFMGDLVDYGNDDYEVLGSLVHLHDQVRDAGKSDEVVALFGDHEVINMRGVYDDAVLRFRRNRVVRKLRSSAFGNTNAPGMLLRSEGRVAYKAADSLFVHAGLTEKDAQLGVDKLNEAARAAIAANNFTAPIFNENGPMFYGEMASAAVNGNCDVVSRVAAAAGVSRVIINDIPTRTGGVQAFCDGKLVSVGSGSTHDGAASTTVLEILEMSYANGENQPAARTEVVLRQLQL